MSADRGESAAAPLNVDDFLHRVRGDTALASALAKLYLGEYPSQLDAVRRAVASREAAELDRAAHALKGSVANFSAEPATLAAARLEVMGRTGDLTGSAEVLRTLETELDRLSQALLEMIS